MNKHLFALGLLIAIIPASAFSASVTETITTTSGTLTLTTYTYPGSTLVKYSMDWTSDANGNVTADVQPIVGEILRVVTNPGATAPSDNYDIVLNDEDGLDTLNGGGANRDTANTEHFAPFVGDATSYTSVSVSGTLSLAITNAGAAKVGDLILYVRR